MAVRVLIAGAGIAGLTTALSLHAAGIEALIVEPALELKPMGAGINLLPHAVGELTELGLGGELEAAGIATSERAHFDRHGNLIWSEPRGRGLGYNCVSTQLAPMIMEPCPVNSCLKAATPTQTTNSPRFQVKPQVSAPGRTRTCDPLLRRSFRFIL